MNYINKTVSVYGTEAEFMKAFATELHSADSRIVCETDIEAEFSKENTYKPVIVFNVNNCYKINFKRISQLSIGAQGYSIICVINGNESTNSVFVQFAQSANPLMAIVERCYKFSLIFNTNFIVINFAGYKYTLPLQSEFNMFSYHTDGFNIVSAMPGSGTAIPAIQRSLIRTDETGNGDIYTFANRLNYGCKENMEIIESKVLLQSDNAERIVTDIIDCSTVSKDSIVNIDGSKYYALDEHTLALISESKIEIN